MNLDTITLDDALQLLSLPRVLGTNSAGDEITVQNGRYGPYLKKGTDSRSLATEDQIFTVTLDEARQLVHGDEEITSHVGHEATCRIMSTLLGVDVPLSRAPFSHGKGQVALCFKLRGRLAEGRRELTHLEVEAIGYDLKVLTRLA